jgi:HSP20 family protein
MASTDDLLGGHERGDGAQRIPVNVYRTTESIVVVAPMPGVTPDDIEIVLEGDRVHLHADLRTPADKDYLLHEWDYGCYDRTVDLPEVVGWPVVASLGNGQLAVSLHRGGEARADRVAVEQLAS